MPSSPPNIMPILAQGYISSRQASPAASLARSRTNSAAKTPSSTSRTSRRDRGGGDAESSPSPMEGSGSVYSVTDTQLAERYQFLREVGYGNWGSVWSCRPKYASSPDARIAVKLVHRSEDPASSARVRSLWAEYKAVRTLDKRSASIIKFSSFLLSPSYALIVMDYHPRLIPVEIPEEKAQHYLYQLVCAVDFLHTIGCSHNDIKPGNILLSHKDVPVLVDFGFSHTYTATQPSRFESSLSWGTPEYLAPERAKGIKHDERLSDIWSLGVTMYEIVVGRTPFEMMDSEEFLTKTALEVYYRRTKTGEFYGELTITDDFRQIIKAMVEPDVSLRIKSCGAASNYPFFETSVALFGSNSKNALVTPKSTPTTTTRKSPARSKGIRSDKKTFQIYEDAGPIPTTPQSPRNVLGDSHRVLQQQAANKAPIKSAPITFSRSKRDRENIKQKFEDTPTKCSQPNQKIDEKASPIFSTPATTESSRHVPAVISNLLHSPVQPQPTYLQVFKLEVPSLTVGCVPSNVKESGTGVKKGNSQLASGETWTPGDVRAIESKRLLTPEPPTNLFKTSLRRAVSALSIRSAVAKGSNPSKSSTLDLYSISSRVSTIGMNDVEFLSQVDATEEWILLDDQPTTSKSSGEERAQKFSQQLQEIIDNHSKVDGPTLLAKKSVLSLRSELGQADLDRRSMLAPFEVKNFTEKVSQELHRIRISRKAEPTTTSSHSASAGEKSWKTSNSLSEDDVRAKRESDAIRIRTVGETRRSKFTPPRVSLGTTHSLYQQFLRATPRIERPSYTPSTPTSSAIRDPRSESRLSTTDTQLSLTTSTASGRSLNLGSRIFSSSASSISRSVEFEKDMKNVPTEIGSGVVVTPAGKVEGKWKKALNKFRI